MPAQNANYPTTPVDRQQLADELTARGLKPTQSQQHFDRVKIDRMVDAMKDGTFDWNKASLQPVILGPAARSSVAIIVWWPPIWPGLT